MTTDVRVGRLLSACLHQGIMDMLPQRLEFYEHWLNNEGLRDGSIGIGPITAVLGFLRTEGDGYDRVVARAGRLAAEWTIASLPGFRRRSIGWLPQRLRVWAALRVAAGIVQDISSASRASVRVRKRAARFSISTSLFCSVRDAQQLPLCGFYAAVATESLTRLGVTARGRVERCRAVDGGTCTVAIDISGVESAADPAIAA
jgi:hypothetical protein